MKSLFGNKKCETGGKARNVRNKRDEQNPLPNFLPGIFSPQKGEKKGWESTQNFALPAGVG